MACNAKIDQIDMPIGGAHDIGGLQIAKNDRRWLLLVQVAQHDTQLDTNLQGFVQWKLAPLAVQIVLKRFALEETHHQVPAPVLLKVIKNAGQIGML